MRIRLVGKRAAGRFALVDGKDLKLVSGYAWQVHESKHKGHKPTAYAYARTRRDGREVFVYMHRLITGWPLTDHINHDGLDNRRRNLRPATPAQNSYNRRPNAGSSSKYKGVMWSPHRSKWKAAIKAGGEQRCLGFFDDEDDAALAYNAAALEGHGEYAYLNKVRRKPEALASLDAKQGPAAARDRAQSGTSSRSTQ